MTGTRWQVGLKNITIVGMDCHIGSQITESKPFTDALESLKDLINELRKIGIQIKYMDVGGGLGITYNDESPPHPREYAKAIVDSLKGLDLHLILEPGRVIVGNAGILVSRVLFRKSGKVKEFVIADAGMNDLMRPTLYDAFHAIAPVRKTEDEQINGRRCGPDLRDRRFSGSRSENSRCKERRPFCGDECRGLWF